MKSTFTLTILGAAGGTLFGIGFGALASVFQGGPDMLIGMTESWWWFASMGVFFGLALAQERKLQTVKES